MALPQISIGNGMLGTALLASVEITQELNRHWWCSIVCRETEETRIPVEDMLGKSVEITTTDEEGVTSTHFSGFVYDVELDYEIYGSYGARIVAVSKSYLLDQSSYKHYYTAATLSSVASIIGGRTGLTISAKPPARKALNYVQYGETDYAFLLRLADDYGAWVRPTADGIEILDSFQSGKTVVWRDHDGLTSFKLAASMAPTSVSGSHYDFHAMQSSTFSKTQKQPQFYDGGSRLTSAVVAASQSLPTSFESTRGRAMTVSDYDEQLQAESERLMGSAVTGRGSSQYQPLKAGDTVAVQGTLDAAGTYGLTRVVHRWTPKGYSNDFQCTPWKQYRSPKPPAMNTWEGVVPARVVAHNDPKKMGRLQVQFFWQQDSSTHWARMISPHAGPDRGMMFMPEVGDEVAVMFEDGDPERPIIVGSLWNGVQQAPRVGYFAPTGDIPDNNVKRIYTKSGNRLQMIDTPGVESVALATPNSTKLIKTEHDASTGRTLVHLHSDGDIVLTAPQGRVHIASKFFSREVGDPGTSPSTEAGASAVGLPAAAGAAAPKKANCDYLKPGGFRVSGTPAQFNTNRAKASMGTATKVSGGSTDFPGSSKPLAATKQVVTINGHPVTITRSTEAPVEPKTNLPSNTDVAHSLGAIPTNQLNYVHQVVVSPLRSPNDAYWAKQYGMTGFRSQADAGASGTVHMYPIPNGTDPILDATLIHESGHSYSKSIWKTDAQWNDWENARKNDKQAPSQYATRSRDEDFSESLVMYALSKGTPCESAAKILYPNRYAILDKLLSQQKAQPKNGGHTK